MQVISLCVADIFKFYKILLQHKILGSSMYIWHYESASTVYIFFNFCLFNVWSAHTVISMLYIHVATKKILCFNFWVSTCLKMKINMCKD